jgi:predicted porin
VIRDDYPDSALGLIDADNQNYQLNATYFPTPGIQFNAFLAHDRYESRQRGSATGTAAYQVDFDDSVNTVGVGANIDNAWKLWDLGINYQYSGGTGEINYSNPARPGSSYPDLRNDLHHVRMNAAYQVKKNTRINFSVIYENMRADDWALDGVPAYPVNQLLTLGNDTEDYDVFAFMVALQYRF